MKAYLSTLNRRHPLLGIVSAAVSAAFLLPHGGGVLSAAPASTPVGPASTPGLVWDAELKEVHVEPGAAKTSFKFWFTNCASREISIQSAKSTCFCTVAKLPSEPWAIPAGGCGSIDVTMDLTGKRGTVTKAINVATTAGNKSLLVRANIPYDPVSAPVTLAVPTHSGAGSRSGSEEERLKNLQMALADRQVVFKKAECAECHAKPADGLTAGAEIYAGVCAVCHDSPQRASTVPDLKIPGSGQNLDYWRNWIGHGRPGTMMPAFAKSEGGPLSDSQLEVLAEYLAMTVVPAEPKSTGTTQLAPLPFPEFFNVQPLIQASR
jgi:mono/diheme cytochrome c family protein